MTFTIRIAERRQAKLRLALQGVSDSGKSSGAINIALGMGKKFIVIDTERRSVDWHADDHQIPVIDLEAPFTPQKYIDAIKFAEWKGYEIIIVDSLSHAWAGEGGMLDMQSIATDASRSKNSYMAWREVTPIYNRFVDTILQSPSHIIVTLRVKTHYEIAEINGRKSPVKMGLEPIQRPNLDYEFTTILELDGKTHFYTASKDRTKLFNGRHELISQETGKEILNWLNCGKSQEEADHEEQEKLKSDLMKSSTVESLRACFKIARQKFPTMESEFIDISKKRQLELQPVLQEEIH